MRVNGIYTPTYTPTYTPSNLNKTTINKPYKPYNPYTPYVKTSHTNMCTSIAYPVSFGYSHKLKSMWKDGLLPSVKKGLYGGKLTKHSISLEHIQPHSSGIGPTVEWNLALADRFLNSNRGNAPLDHYLTKPLAIQYLEQFRDVKINNEKYKFTGNDYIRKIVHTFRRNGVDVSEHFKDLMG